MEFDIADPPLPIMEFSIIFFIFLNEGFPYASHRILYYMRPLKETKKKDRWRPKRHLDRSREKM